VMPPQAIGEAGVPSQDRSMTHQPKKGNA